MPLDLYLQMDLVSIIHISVFLQIHISPAWPSCSTRQNSLTLHNTDRRWDHKQKLCRLCNQRVRRSCFQNKQACGHRDNTPFLSCRCDRSAQWKKLSQAPRRLRSWSSCFYWQGFNPSSPWADLRFSRVIRTWRIMSSQWCSLCCDCTIRSSEASWEIVLM